MKQKKCPVCNQEREHYEDKDEVCETCKLLKSLEEEDCFVAH